MNRPRLRGRLLAAFVLVAVPPLLVFSAVVAALVSRRFEETARGRLDAGLEATQERVAALRRRAEVQVAAVVEEDLPAARPTEGAERSVADEIARRRELPVLEIVDARGRVISSHHWPAGFGLEDRDGLFPGDPTLRIEKVAEGYGVAERLALVAERPAVWRGAVVMVRGGSFLDREFLEDLSRLMGAQVAVYDGVRGRWLGQERSPLRAWTAPALASKAGTVRLGGEAWRWAAAPLQPALSLVVATPAGALDEVLAEVRRLTLLLAGLALLVALVGAVALSGRIALPIRELAQGARRIADGDLEGSVPVRTDDEIGDLARAFNAMTAELRASRERLVQVERVAAWREMARRLAHELKKPLFPIQLSIETLRRWFEREPLEASAPPRARPDPEFVGLLRESTDTVLQELRSLRAIVDEFSEFARLPRPRRQAEELERVVDQVLALYQARMAGIRLERATEPAPIVVSADADLLARALGNLVANALEAMPEGGTLKVCTARRAGAAVLEVEDTGAGLDAEAQMHLFTPYHTTKPGGTGLGLAIAQGIVTDHGGRIEVESEPGRGARFSIVLPLGGRETAS